MSPHFKITTSKIFPNLFINLAIFQTYTAIHINKGERNLKTYFCKKVVMTISINTGEKLCFLTYVRRLAAFIVPMTLTMGILLATSALAFSSTARCT